MITISIQPFARRKLVALGVTLLCASTVSCFADAMYLTRGQASERQPTVSQQSSVPTEQAGPSQFGSVSGEWTANFRQVNESEQGGTTVGGESGFCASGGLA